ncbi:MAG: helix-turn-helix transcriptional regulator [Clostridiales bacterium]|nr:helix-turn-helix transcriptional regulator [Clostridiales bacterium]
MEFGEKIAALRKERGMTQAELGTELNVTFQAVSKWERGESLPDFATMSRLAKLFGVPLTYFEEGGEIADSDAPEEVPQEKEPQEKMIGVCTTCGMVVYDGQQGRTSPSLVCRSCCEKERQAAVAKIKEQEKQQAEAKRHAEFAKQASIAEMRGKRNKGFIIGGIIAAVVLIISIVSAVTDTEPGLVIGGGILFTVFTFTFVTQLVWGGVVRDVCLTGGAIVGMPGVIFTLDLDGMIFLIVVKILFAVLKMLIFIVTTLFFVVVALVISLFTFVPRLLKIQAEIASVK